MIPSQDASIDAFDPIQNLLPCGRVFYRSPRDISPSLAAEMLTGGVGHEQLREFYSQRFIPQMPPDTEMTPVSRTIGEDQIVDEMVFKFTHTIPMDWILPGIPPTGKPVEVPLVAIVRFRDNKLAHEHIYWDQASVLVQIGLLDPAKLPVAGVESAKKVLDPSLPANELMQRGSATQLTTKNK